MYSKDGFPFIEVGQIENYLSVKTACTKQSLVKNIYTVSGGQYYYTNQYGARMLEQAVRNGYEEGFYAGQADRQDGWGYDYNSSFGFQDASFGYDSYYVGLDEYNYYFREGFRRGYEDGYHGRNQYGRYDNGGFNILGSILNAILSFSQF